MTKPRSLAPLLLLLSAACSTGCSTRAANRAALVPHMTPTLRSGAPMEAGAELDLGLSSLGHSSLESAHDNVGVEIPGTQAEGGLRLRLGRYLAAGLVHARGFDAGAQALEPSQPPVDGGDALGLGVTLDGSIPTGDPRLHVGVSVELLRWRVPYVEYEVCVQECGGVPWSSVERGHDDVEQVALGVVPTYAAGRWRAWGGFTLRTHPVLEKKGLEVGAADAEVEPGEFNLVLSAGFDAELGHGVRAGATAYQVVSASPAHYGPSLAAMLTIPLGRRDGEPVR